MANTLTLKQLHLQCRLRIADLNHYINSLRIFSDYLYESSPAPANTSTAATHKYEKQFTGLRAEIDSVSNELHLTKMNLARAYKSEPDGDVSAFDAKAFQGLQSRYSHLKTRITQLELEILSNEK